MGDLFENYNETVNEAVRGTPKGIWDGKEQPEEGGKQITVKNSKGQTLKKISYKLLKVGAVEEDRSVKETAEEKAKRKAKKKKVEGEARSARAMSKMRIRSRPRSFYLRTSSNCRCWMRRT